MTQFQYILLFYQIDLIREDQTLKSSSQAAQSKHLIREYQTLKSQPPSLIPNICLIKYKVFNRRHHNYNPIVQTDPFHLKLALNMGKILVKSAPLKLILIFLPQRCEGKFSWSCSDLPNSSKIGHTFRGATERVGKKGFQRRINFKNY